MVKNLAVSIMVLVVLIAGNLLVLAQDNQGAADQAIDFLLTVQNSDGGFSNGWAPESDIGTTADVVVSAVLAGHDPEAFFAGDMMNPLSYLGLHVQNGDVLTAGAGAQAKVLMAAAAVGKDVDAFGGTDLVADLLAMQNAQGLFGYGAFEHCLAMIALQNTAVELPEGAVDALVAAQNEDGGWGFMDGEASDTNTSGLCVQALVPVVAEDPIARGLSYFAAIQNEDGGWPYQNPSEWGTESDVNSTALVTQALIAAGQDLGEWNSPQDWLLTLQNESGAFGYQTMMPDDNIVATVGAIPALLNAPQNFWALESSAE